MAKTFKMHVRMDNAAFEDDFGAAIELNDMLGDVALHLIEHGTAAPRQGALLDSNGAHVGAWYIEEVED